VLPVHGTFTRGVSEQTIVIHRYEVNISHSTNRLETIKMLMSVELGWNALPESMLSKDIGAVPVQGLHIKRDLGMVWHKDRTLSNAAAALKSLQQHTAD